VAQALYIGIFAQDFVLHFACRNECCRVLRCVVVCCSVSQFDVEAWRRRPYTSAFSNKTLRHTSLAGMCAIVCCSVLRCVAVCCSVLQCVIVCDSVLQSDSLAVCCSVSQCVAE